MLLSVVFLIAGIAVLIKGADWLVQGAAAVARRFNVSELVIGLTVVALGTSCPELFVNVAAGLKGSPAIAVGNILGSNIANVFLVLGIAAMIHPLAVTRGTVFKEIPFSLLAILVLGVVANDRLIDGSAASAISRSDGMVLLAFFVIFLTYSFAIAANGSGAHGPAPPGTHSTVKALLLAAAGLGGLTLGGHWIVDSAVDIGKRLGIRESVIGLSVVALGTSLPELATSAVAAYRRNVDIAVGNVVGSNIFNIFFVMGLSAVIAPVPFEERNDVDIAVAVFASLLMFLFMFSGKKHRVDRWEGAVSVAFYLTYIGYLATQARI
jgi:cation:H+ antiporter